MPLLPDGLAQFPQEFDVTVCRECRPLQVHAFVNFESVDRDEEERPTIIWNVLQAFSGWAVPSRYSGLELITVARVERDFDCFLRCSRNARTEGILSGEDKLAESTRAPSKFEGVTRYSFDSPQILRAG